ncbi:MAG: glycosyltransferase family 4 protein [Candidatus Latescibacteria bacterium]|nr:glycosyltransferase family 4 protein [Candidatus Latescibacterota bacterium]
MKIVHIIPGSGGSFYCQNCMRDNDLVKSLMALGHEIHMVPMYLPLSIEKNDQPDDIPIFYGAINMYLKDKLPSYRFAPNWMKKLFDSQPFLRFAAKKSGSTRASGLEEMTISMLKGEEGRQAAELKHLVGYLAQEIKPDIIHLSNALLLGLARRMKIELNAKIVCSLQDENEWIDLMTADYQAIVWALMAERAVDVDMFVSPSKFYFGKSMDYLKIPPEKISVVYNGINPEGYEFSSLPFEPPVIGYLCRMSEYFGLGILVDAFILLKQDSRFPGLKLYLTGGYTGDDKIFVKKMLKKAADFGFENDIRIFEEFDKKSKIQFLKSLTLLSVPVPGGEAFGAYQVEALAAGVPIVQPNVGGFPEFIETTGGGIIYEPNDGENLAKALASLLTQPDRIRKLGENGRKIVLEKYSLSIMAKNMMKLYEEL